MQDWHCDGETVPTWRFTKSRTDREHVGGEAEPQERATMIEPVRGCKTSSGRASVVLSTKDKIN